ncbi:HVO_2922 family protein [Halorussus halobius]|uniref:HVO_2922 family protein n=1 Tax=Halorussus halobius TaxID=1710537 RepID=UPI001FCE41F2|nr:HVO_2922 family protein [Halorussus halobius]
MSTKTGDSALIRIYSERFGEPLTSDEVYGYWLFVVSVLAGGLGVLALLATDGISTMRQTAIMLTALGLTGAVTGLVVGQSFDRRAKWLVYVGAALSVLAVAWFTTVYPSQWELGRSATTNVVGLYILGIGIVALSGVIAPVIVGQSRAREAAEEALVTAQEQASDRSEEASELRDRLAEREDEIADLEAELDDLRGARDDAEAEARTSTESAAAERARADDAEAHLDRLHDSSATFEMYKDKADEWRWRLVHQNGNIVATGGEGYASDRNARRGMRSVKRNALGAEVIWHREAEDPDPEPDPVLEDPQATFELYRDDADEYRWRLRHDNGEIIAAAARGFSSKSAARDGLDAVRTYVGPADYLEFDPTAFEVYEDAAGEYRWRLVHRNGRILADSGEGYASRSNARRAVETVTATADSAAVGADDGARFEVYEDAADEHRWRLVSANDEIIADSGQGYGDRSSATDAVERVRDYVPDADTLTVGEAAVEVYEDAAGEFRWRLRHRNGTILATGGEGYSDRSGAVDGVNSVKRNAPNTPVVEDGEQNEA